MENSGISWTTHTFNPWIGCTKCSTGCDHCYAEGFNKRMGQTNWGAGGRTPCDKRLELAESDQVEPPGGSGRDSNQSILRIDGRHLRRGGASRSSGASLGSHSGNAVPGLATADEAPDKHRSVPAEGLGGRLRQHLSHGVPSWADAPRDILSYIWCDTLGGYQVLKKWLSYRELPLLGRALRSDESDYFAQVVRRITAILLLGPALDASYQAILPTATGLPQP